VSENHQRPAFNGGLFNENRRNFPAHELAHYAGRYIAWNLDGTRIVASGADEGALYAQLAAANIDLNTVVQSYVPSAEEEAFL